MNTFNKLAFAGTMALASMTAQAAIHATASLDWAGLEIIKSSDSIETTFALNITPQLPLYTTAHQLSALAPAPHECVNHGYGCSVVTPITDPEFTETASLSTPTNSVSSTINQSQTSAVADVWGRVAFAAPAGFAKLAVSSAGTVTVRVPYTLTVVKDASTSTQIQTAISEVTFGHVVANGSFYDGGQDWDSARLAEYESAANKSQTGVLELVLVSNGATEYELSYGSYAYGQTGVRPPVPEPETYALLTIGLAGVVAARRKKKA